MHSWHLESAAHPCHSTLPSNLSVVNVNAAKTLAKTMAVATPFTQETLLQHLNWTGARVRYSLSVTGSQEMNVRCYVMMTTCAIHMLWILDAAFTEVLSMELLETLLQANNAILRTMMPKYV